MRDSVTAQRVTLTRDSVTAQRVRPIRDSVTAQRVRPIRDSVTARPRPAPVQPPVPSLRDEIIRTLPPDTRGVSSVDCLLIFTGQPA